MTISIPVLDKSAEMVAQAYVQHIHVTFESWLTFIMDKGRKLKKELFPKAAEELGMEHLFSSTHLSQSNGILEFFSFLKCALENAYTEN